MFDGNYSTVVCEGYAKAFAFILNILDIPNVYVVGDAGGGHAWNAVSFDGGETYYYVDATWDDQGGRSSTVAVENQFVYYAMPKDTFEESHTPHTPAGADNDWQYAMPVLGNDMDYTYYVRYAAYATNETVNSPETAQEFLKGARALAPGADCLLLLPDRDMLVDIIAPVLNLLGTIYWIPVNDYNMIVYVNSAEAFRPSVPAAALSFSETEVTINKAVATEQELTITSATENSDDYITFYSSNESVAMVKTPYVKARDGESVRVVAKRTGTATIYAKSASGGATASCVVTVTDGSEPIATPSPSPTATPSPSPTVTPSPSPTATPSPSPTATSSPSPTATPSPSPTATPSPSPTATPSPSPTATPSSSPTVISSPSPTATSSPSPTVTSSPSPTATSSPSPTATPSSSPTVTSSPSPTSTPSLSPTVTPSPGSTPTAAPSPTPTVTPTPGVTPVPAPSPTVTPGPSSVVTASPSPAVTPTATPTASATPGAAVRPSQRPTVIWTAMPTIAPTIVPTASASVMPTSIPTASPTISATTTPGVVQTANPSAAATVRPSAGPTVRPTTVPTSKPSPSSAAVKKGQKFSDGKTQAVYRVTGTGKNRTVEYLGSTKKNAKTVVIPATVNINGLSYKVTSISKNAFAGNTSLKTVIIGKNVRTIGKGAFSGCKKLNKVKMGKNVTTIKEKAFNQCISLKKITIPSKVTKIGKKAFYQCKNLQYILVKSNKLASGNIGKNAFGGGHRTPRVKTDKRLWRRYANLLVLRGLSEKALFIINPVKLMI